MTLYGANEVGFAEAIEACNKQGNGRYSIRYVVLRGYHPLERLGAPSAGSGATNGKFERSDTTLKPHTTDAQVSTP